MGKRNDPVVIHSQASETGSCSQAIVRHTEASMFAPQVASLVAQRNRDCAQIRTSFPCRRSSTLLAHLGQELAQLDHVDHRLFLKSIELGLSQQFGDSLEDKACEQDPPHCRHVGWQSRPRADQDADWLVRIAADHIERVATIEHGRRRYVEVSQALLFVPFLGGVHDRRRTGVANSGTHESCGVAVFQLGLA
jgi:hypothetical protein